MKFTKTLKSSICALALTAALTVPTASAALASPVIRSEVSATVSTAAKPPYPMYGGIGGKWGAVGGARSSLGNPIGYQYGGLRNGGAVQNFQHGSIVWSPATGARISHGSIRVVWLNTGSMNGRLGYPRTDEYLVNGGVRQDYQGGSITWSRGTHQTTASYPAPPKPRATPVNNSPAGAKAYAKAYIQSIGWGPSQFQCLVTVWNHESGWNFAAGNAYGAYGIPQSLPGSKMASAGGDWRTNSQTQIRWGVGYIKGRYGTPCGASNAWNVQGWY